jgi:hypothetical protein
MESDTEHEHYSPENQLGLSENRAWVDHPDSQRQAVSTGLTAG